MIEADYDYWKRLAEDREAYEAEKTAVADTVVGILDSRFPGLADRLEMTAPPRFPYREPCRSVDASHPDIALDTNRCISCGRCIRASQDVDGKGVFGYVGRGIHRRLSVNGADLSDTDAEVTDFAISSEVCPVGCILRKREGFSTPIGEREFDKGLIGSEIERKRDE